MNMHSALPAKPALVPHILQTQQFGLAELERLFALADEILEGTPVYMAGKIMCSLFYEPSTRTRLSFESAMLRLGGNYIGTENAELFSSVAKGESLEDTIRVVGQYAHVIVLRHKEDNAAKRAATVSSVPVINAGCGKDQHPTQALLDVYTIRRRKSLTNLRVALMGDIKHGRTVHSLAYLLGKYPGMQLFFVSPQGLELPQNMRMHFNEHGIRFAEFNDVEEIIDLVDVLYVTRVQLERMHEDDRVKFEGSYNLHRGLAQRMREGSLIMHPLPRTGEISTDVDTLPGAVYLKSQVESGLLVRMALLKTLLA